MIKKNKTNQDRHFQSNSFTLEPTKAKKDFNKWLNKDEFSTDDCLKDFKILNVTRMKILSFKNVMLIEENSKLVKKIELLTDRLISAESSLVNENLIKCSLRYLNDKLTVILFNIDLLNKEIHKLNRINELKESNALKIIENLKTYFNDIVVEIRSAEDLFSYYSLDGYRNTDVNKLIISEFKLLSNDCFFRDHVKLKIEKQEKLPLVRINLKDLSILIRHVIHNALDAMLLSSVRELTVKIGSNIKHVYIEIIDTGCGISNDALVHIFDLLYTTKNKSGSQKECMVSRPLGIGLYLVSKIAEKYQIRLELKSEIGKGTVFGIWIPIL